MDTTQLPALTGSPEQIAKAEPLRAEAIAKYTEGLQRAEIALACNDRAAAMAAYKAHVAGHKGAEELCQGYETIEAARKAVETLLATTSAAIWIAHSRHAIHLYI